MNTHPSDLQTATLTLLGAGERGGGRRDYGHDRRQIGNPIPVNAITGATLHGSMQQCGQRYFVIMLLRGN